MAGLRLRLLIAVALGVVACSSGSSPAVDTPNVAVEQDASTTTSGAPTVEAVESRQAFRRLAERTEIFVDGAYVATATGVVECFAGTCSSPLDYERGVEIVIPAGGEIRFEHSDVELRGSARRLSEQLRFLGVDGDGSATFRLSEPGLYHLSVSGEIRRETGATDRFHHFAWAQIAEPGTQCGGPVVPVGSISGVTDERGCPSSDGELNFEALHPSYHCNPWPAQLRLDERPGSVFVFAGPFRSIPSADASQATGLKIPSGDILLYPEVVDVLVTKGAEQQFRWLLDETGEECL